MKFVCLGYADEKKWDAMTAKKQQSLMEDCFAYDDVLRKNGHFIGGEALQSSSKAATLRFRNGKVLVTDGPFAETKEQLGGLLLLEARDLDHAIELLSKHPGLGFASFEIRPADEEINKMVAEKSAVASK